MGSARIARVHAFLLSTHPLICLEHTGSATRLTKITANRTCDLAKSRFFLDSARGSHNHPARAYREPCPAELPLSTHPVCGGCTGGAAPGHSRPTPGRYCGARPPGAGSRSPAWRALHARAALSRPPMPPSGQLRRPRHTRDTSKSPRHQPDERGWQHGRHKRPFCSPPRASGGLRRATWPKIRLTLRSQ